jgi:hypothetical protein
MLFLNENCKNKESACSGRLVSVLYKVVNPVQNVPDPDLASTMAYIRIRNLSMVLCI